MAKFPTTSLVTITIVLATLSCSSADELKRSFGTSAGRTATFHTLQPQTFHPTDSSGTRTGISTLQSRGHDTEIGTKHNTLERRDATTAKGNGTTNNGTGSHEGTTRRDETTRTETGQSTKDFGKHQGTAIKEGSDHVLKPITSSTAAREARTPVTFTDKPTNVAHNPEHQEGSLGRESDHKSVLVERDGHYFKRDYYSGSGGGVTTWYWYETPLDDSDPIIPVLPYVAICAGGRDDCRIEPKPGDRGRFQEPGVIAGWWPWQWGLPDPIVVKGRCEVNTRPMTPASQIGDVEVFCRNVVGSCNAHCQLFDAAGARADDDTGTAPGTKGAAALKYSCGCPSN